MRILANGIFGLALTLGLASGFAEEAKSAAAATPVDKAAISAQADDNCEKAKADCPKGKDCPKGSQCAKAHAKGRHAAAGGSKEKGGEHKDKAGEAKTAPEAPGAEKPQGKLVEPAKEG